MPQLPDPSVQLPPGELPHRSVSLLLHPPGVRVRLELPLHTTAAHHCDTVNSVVQLLHQHQRAPGGGQHVVEWGQRSSVYLYMLSLLHTRKLAAC